MYPTCIPSISPDSLRGGRTGRRVGDGGGGSERGRCKGVGGGAGGCWGGGGGGGGGEWEDWKLTNTVSVSAARLSYVSRCRPARATRGFGTTEKR